MIHFIKTVDSLDACIFNGDSLLMHENRELLRDMIERWQNKLVEWSEIASTLENQP